MIMLCGEILTRASRRNALEKVSRAANCGRWLIPAVTVPRVPEKKNGRLITGASPVHHGSK